MFAAAGVGMFIEELFSLIALLLVGLFGGRIKLKSQILYCCGVTQSVNDKAVVDQRIEERTHSTQMKQARLMAWGVAFLKGLLLWWAINLVSVSESRMFPSSASRAYPLVATIFLMSQFLLSRRWIFGDSLLPTITGMVWSSYFLILPHFIQHFSYQIHLLGIALLITLVLGLFTYLQIRFAMKESERAFSRLVMICAVICAIPGVMIASELVTNLHGPLIVSLLAVTVVFIVPALLLLEILGYRKSKA